MGRVGARKGAFEGVLPLVLLENLLACFLRVTTSHGPYLSSSEWLGTVTIPVSVVGLEPAVTSRPGSEFVVGALPAAGERTSPSEERESSA